LPASAGPAARVRNAAAAAKKRVDIKTPSRAVHQVGIAPISNCYSS
jgi:hypothetical protein